MLKCAMLGAFTVLKRTVYENIHNFTLKIFAYLDLHV